MMVAAIIVITSAVVWGSWFQHMASHLLFEKLESKARLIVTSYKDPVIDAILEVELENLIGRETLENIVDELVHNSELPALYAYITDPSGTVVVSDKLDEYGRRNGDAFAAEALKQGDFKQRIVGDRWDDTGLLDIAMPLNVHGKKWGVFRVSFPLRPLHKQLAELKGVILTLTFIICLIQMGVFFVVGLSLTRPLKELAGAMAAVDPVNLTSPLKVNRRDEIGTLQKSFRLMLDKLKQSESERQRAVNSLVQSEKLAIVGKLAAGVAHEVNNPLAAMNNCIFNLKQTATGETSPDIDILTQACRQIENIVQQLLDFNRAGQLILEPVQSDAFFREITAMSEMALKKKGVVFSINDRCSPPLQLTIDKWKLTQVALNLLMNAAEASPPGESVEVSAYTEEGAYCLAIKDHGMGIPPELQEKIFELFYTLKSNRKGNGIGLAISRNIVDMHCGAILLESRPGETTFTVIIPLDGEKQHAIS